MNRQAAKQLKRANRIIGAIIRMLPFGSEAAMTLGMIVERLDEVQIKLMREDEFK
ncbi:hypothetical protein MH117_04860 [Paenibacillus sp. ACRRX]|uniref:hypothetical protein n=1 Tax=Paenibacillus sp. ACRRX TaxID=2918206 RepID=UPI001EF45BC3|nr:hypothetical protein [Paenibacillus sp. ACRRX]MCG7406740.1 hypothetical protein [Paenibacillus sp. ACRRX]